MSNRKPRMPSVPRPTPSARPAAEPPQNAPREANIPQRPEYPPGSERTEQARQPKRTPPTRFARERERERDYDIEDLKKRGIVKELISVFSSAPPKLQEESSTVPGSASATEDRVPTPAKRLSPKPILFGFAALLLVMLFFPGVKMYLEQHTAHVAATEKLDKVKALNEELEMDLDKWSDSEFVKTQARERLGLQMEGETSYMVIGDEVTEEEKAEKEAKVPDNWMDRLAQSFLESSIEAPQE